MVGWGGGVDVVVGGGGVDVVVITGVVLDPRFNLRTRMTSAARDTHDVVAGGGALVVVGAGAGVLVVVGAGSGVDAPSTKPLGQVLAPEENVPFCPARRGQSAWG